MLPYAVLDEALDSWKVSIANGAMQVMVFGHEVSSDSSRRLEPSFRADRTVIRLSLGWVEF
jgi:hypothetical protein